MSGIEDCIQDLEKHGQLVRIPFETDPHLEMTEIHRRVFEAGGPAILFENVKGSKFRAVSNIYGTYDRTRLLFRHTLKHVEKLVELKADPVRLLKQFGSYFPAAITARKALPKKTGRLPVTEETCKLSDLPQIVGWPKDGGAFITLPQVLTLPPGVQSMMQSNLGMYRIQISGNAYIRDEEAGMHYQLHRGIGVHHRMYLDTDEPFRASIFVGGPPSHAFAAIMPLPEGLSELSFAGMLAGRRFRYGWHNGFVISADADFCITGIVSKERKKPEGPFGDHLGYYSLEHDFPVFEIENVYHRRNAVWQFTLVGRPPQEDSNFGRLIHDIVTPLLSSEFPGIREVNAVDAAGVHPLLLAIGSERYMPFRDKKPEEILTQANHLLGKGQTSLAKYLIIADITDHPELTTHNIESFFSHVLERIDLGRDLHFQTKTTIDTLDYSGTGWNAGSKVVIACCGEKRRELNTALPANLNLPEGYGNAVLWRPGIVVIQGKPFSTYLDAGEDLDRLKEALRIQLDSTYPLVVIADDAEFTSATLNNFLWVTFTRSNPSHDIYGVGSSVEYKHWGCTGPLIIDARLKPHHAPVLESDPAVKARVDKYFQKGGLLEKYG